MKQITWNDLECSGNIGLVKKLAMAMIYVNGEDAPPVNGLVSWFHRCRQILEGSSSIHVPESRDPSRWDGWSAVDLWPDKVIERYSTQFDVNAGIKKAEYSYRAATAQELTQAKGQCLYKTAISAMSPDQKRRAIMALDMIFPAVRPGFEEEIPQEILDQYDSDGDFSVSEAAVCAACGGEIIITRQDRSRNGHRVYYTRDGWPVCGDECEDRLGACGDDMGFTSDDAAAKLLAHMPAELAAKIAATKIGEFLQIPTKQVGRNDFAFALSSEIIVVICGDVHRVYLPSEERNFSGSGSKYRRLYRRKVSRACLK